MDYIGELNGLALASRMKRVVEKLNSDMKGIYHERKIDFEPLLMPIMKLLQSKGALHVYEITEFLQISQPAVTQFCTILAKKKLIEITPNKFDKRKKEIALNEHGIHTLEHLAPVWNAVEATVKSMIDHSEHNLLKAIDSFERQHALKSLKERVLEQLNDHVVPASIEIIPYKEKHKNDFKRLNYEWITKSFSVEKSDKHVLANPKKTILDKGGYVYFAKHNKEIVGTFALIKVDAGTYEIAKMAVTGKYQKLGIGQKLLDHGIKKAKNLKLKRLVLYSNTLLAPAINLYFKNGFKVIPKTDLHNNRANIKMEKIL